MSNKPRKHLSVWWAQLRGKPYVSFNGSRNLAKDIKKVELKRNPTPMSAFVLDLLEASQTGKVVIEVSKKENK